MLATPNDAAIHQELAERWLDARRRSDELFALVRPDSLYERPIPERHRIIFYIGHLEAFDWNLLRERAFGLKTFHAEFDRLFAFGIDPVGSGLPADQPSDWPSIDEVRGYVAKIRGILDKQLADGIFNSDSLTDEGFALDTLLNVAIEHRLMHAETLAYMLHQLLPAGKMAQTDAPEIANPPVDHRMVDIPAGIVTLGVPQENKVFGWDNEFEGHLVDVPAFAIDRYKVTNRQFLGFMGAGGYETRSFWSSDDWSWKSENRICHPAFWKREADQWLYRTMFSEIALPLDWPVYVSQAEAKAYARWAGKSLPTEAEWHRAAYSNPRGEERAYPWGSDVPSSRFGNFDFVRWNPTPVNAFPESPSAFGVCDLIGNGWEWTSTAFAPFPGFRAFSFYPGYSADFFDGQHFVMKGGSARTAACMLRHSFRNWFQAHYQYVYAGFRGVSR
jgi:gamma-glutamyl hercynylcysteine S-oxide synthase